MKEGIFNQIARIKTVWKSCFNDLKAIYSPLNFYNPLITSNRSTTYNFVYDQLRFSFWLPAFCPETASVRLGRERTPQSATNHIL